MEILENIVTGGMEKCEDGTYRKVFYGLNIAFGKKDALEERYVTTATLEELGFSKEEAAKLAANDAFGSVLQRRDVLDLEKLKSRSTRVLCKDVYPEFNPNLFTKFDKSTCEDRRRVHLKRASLLVLFPQNPLLAAKHLYMKRLFETEMRACEALRQSPCPNIARYVGCKVEDNRVTGIYFEQYEKALEDIPTPLNVNKYVEDIRKGVEHIHSMGYCHNDIRPDNIMVKDDGTAVIVDFDGCLPMGEELFKQAPGEFGRDTNISEEENDWYGLKKTEEWMHKRNEENY